MGKSSDDKKTICCPPGHARIIACKLLISNFAVVEPPALRVKLQPQPTPPRVQVSPSSGSCLQVDAHARLPRSVHPEMAERRLGFFFDKVDGCTKKSFHPKAVQGFLFHFLNLSLGTALNPKAWASLLAVASPFSSTDTELRNEDIVWSISKCGTSA